MLTPPMMRGRPGSSLWRSNPWPTRKGRDGGAGAEGPAASAAASPFSSSAACQVARGDKLRDLGREGSEEDGEGERRRRREKRGAALAATEGERDGARKSEEPVPAMAELLSQREEGKRPRPHPTAHTAGKRHTRPSLLKSISFVHKRLQTPVAAARNLFLFLWADFIILIIPTSPILFSNYEFQ